MTAYAGAQTKNQDKMIDAAAVMTTACANCHRRGQESGWHDHRVGMTLGSATALAQRGIGKTGPNALHTGDNISVKFLPAKDSSPLGFLDPEVLVEPSMMTPRMLTLNPNPEAGLLPERGNCEVYELKNISSQIRH